MTRRHGVVEEQRKTKEAAGAATTDRAFWVSGRNIDCVSAVRIWKTVDAARTLGSPPLGYEPGSSTLIVKSVATELMSHDK